MKDLLQSDYEQAKGRRDMYRFLSATFLGPPGPDLLQKLVEEPFVDEFCSLLSCQAGTQLRSFAAGADPVRDCPVLRREYMDLFVVPTGRYVSPFEDVYRGYGHGKTGPLLGPCAVAVKRLYRKAQTDLDRQCRELPTHVGVELAFMAFLCDREAEAIAARIKKGGGTEVAFEDSLLWQLQHSILGDHLNEWFPALCQAIQVKATTEFYRCLALITEDWLAFDVRTLSEATEKSQAGMTESYAGTHAG